MLRRPSTNANATTETTLMKDPSSTFTVSTEGSSTRSLELSSSDHHRSIDFSSEPTTILAFPDTTNITGCSSSDDDDEDKQQPLCEDDAATEATLTTAAPAPAPAGPPQLEQQPEQQQQQQQELASANHACHDEGSAVDDGLEDDDDSDDDRRQVRFSTVAIYAHAVILGDNPSVSWGPPLALGPHKVHEDHCPLESYERVRQPLRRSKSCLALGRFDREARLTRAGYARSDFRRAQAEIAQLQEWRRRHSQPSLLEKLQRLCAPRKTTTNTFVLRPVDE